MFLVRNTVKEVADKIKISEETQGLSEGFPPAYVNDLINIFSSLNTHG